MKETKKSHSLPGSTSTTFTSPGTPHGPDAESAPKDSGSYDGELTYADAQVGRLLDWLEQKGMTENTLVVAVADHGEGLGDHHEIEHAYLLNEEVLHVPWIMAGPGVKAGHRVSALVSLEDFAPTALELLGMPEAFETQGRSLAPAMRGRIARLGHGLCRDRSALDKLPLGTPAKLDHREVEVHSNTASRTLRPGD